jgi:cytoskeletal protein CcmA (bactofilin family)
MSNRAIRYLAVLFALLVVLSGAAGVAAAETRFDDTVVIGPGETVTGGLEAFATTVVVQGTVEGDLTAFASTIRIEGTVTGNVNAFGATVALGESGVVNGDFNAAGSDVTVAGRIDGEAAIGASTVVLAETASVAGDVRYDGTLDNRGAAVGGSVVFDDSLGVGFVGPDLDFDLGLFGVVYGLLVAFALGAILLLAFPGFSGRVATTGATEAVRSGGVGLLTVIGIPVVLVALLITIVGIPLSLAGVVLYAVGLWVGSVYGRFVVGSWLLSLTDYDNRWLGLVAGLLGYWAVGYLPAVGGIVQFVISLLGIGALALVAYRTYRGRDQVPPAEGGDDSVEPGAPAA